MLCHVVRGIAVQMDKVMPSASARLCYLISAEAWTHPRDELLDHRQMRQAGRTRIAEKDKEQTIC